MKLRYIPNIITCFRFFFIGPVLWGLLSGHYAFAFYFFVLAGVTDALDGLLARWYGWTSYFGAIADPLADKLLLMTSFIALYYLGIIPIWLMVIIVGRDMWIMLGVLSYRCLIGQLEFVPSAISKINTFFQILLVPLLLVDLSFIPLPQIVVKSVMYIVFATSVISFFHYTWIWGKRAVCGPKNASVSLPPSKEAA